MKSGCGIYYYCLQNFKNRTPYDQKGVFTQTQGTLNRIN